MLGAIIAIQLLQLRLSFINNSKSKKVMETQAEAAEALRQINEKLKKIGTESATTLDKVKKLEEAAAGQPNLSPELAQAIEEVKAQVQIVDDLVPDAEPAAETGAPEGGQG